MAARRKLSNLKSQYDCIVIGAGLGGLTCANRLAKAGHSVLLLEHHFQLGGLAAWFKRKEHIFDVALHGFPVGMIKTCRKYWSQDIADHIVQLKGIRFDNPQFSFTTTYDKQSFTSILNEKFDVELSTIEKFFKATRDMTFVDDESMTTRQLFDQFFPGRDDVVRLLMEPITYANGSTLDDPAISYSIVFSNFMNKGVYTFTGGTDLIIRMMEDELVKNGVDIKTRALVEKILVKDGHTCGVVVNGQEVKSKSVVSNGNLKSTILRMLDRDAISKDFRAKTDAVRINTSSCQVYMGIKRGEEVDYIGDLLFTSTADKFDTDLLLSKDVTSRTYSVYYQKSRPKHKRMAIVASTNARFEDWADLTDEEYQHDKDHLARATIDALEKYIPGVHRKIDHIEVSTPRTFKRYTLHVGGSSFGTKFEGLKISRGISEQVHGLYHTGSVAIIMSGWLGAANYGVIVANEADRYIRSLAD